MLSRRIFREIEKFEENPPEGISFYKVGDSMENFEAQIIPDEETPYRGGTFRLKIKIPKLYPITPPLITFITPIFHPNIDEKGRICLNVLTDKGYTPAHTFKELLTDIKSLMAEPCPSDPLNDEAAQWLLKDKESYEEIVRKHTSKYATENSTPYSTSAPNPQPSCSTNNRCGETNMDVCDDPSDVPVVLTASRLSRKRKRLVEN